MFIPMDEPHDDGLIITGNSRFIFFIFLLEYRVIYGSCGILLYEQIILVNSLSYPIACPLIFDDIYGILNRLNNPDRSPVSPLFPCIIGNILSNVFINSMMLSIFVMFPSNHLFCVNSSTLSLNIYQLFLYIPMGVTLNFVLSILYQLKIVN